ncbi:MAG: FAD-binding oxidoreductase [Planctomycetaceae bacterium]|nr:FAD-binding oxidoreductase [Planctomycetaceae bacterium]
MTTSTSNLPISDIIEPTSVPELVDVIRDACDRKEAIYPIGGGTSLNYGLPARQAGSALHMQGISRIIDYPAGDMTITVEAGITMSALDEKLRAEGQQLPLDVPNRETATLGGVLATNHNGPRRFGFGTVRDYVIGISAVDGRGRTFSGGGRVVKNVAGYDFCKLLVGSLGTLGVITEITLKVKPLASRREILVGQPDNLEHAENILATMVQSKTYPMALELVGGSVWQNAPELAGDPDRDWLIAVLEGTDAEVDWMINQLQVEWQSEQIRNQQVIAKEQRASLFQQLVDFPAASNAPLVLKANLVPSGTTEIIKAARDLETDCSIHAHAGNGIVYLRFPEFPTQGISHVVTRELRPVTIAHQGNLVVMSNPGGQEMTRQSVWGGIDEPFWMMDRIKEQFDPLNLLNPGRYIYS